MKLVLCAFFSMILLVSFSSAFAGDGAISLLPPVCGTETIVKEVESNSSYFNSHHEAKDTDETDKNKGIDIFTFGEVSIFFILEDPWKLEARSYDTCTICMKDGEFHDAVSEKYHDIHYPYGPRGAPWVFRIKSKLVPCPKDSYCKAGACVIDT